jgi:[CysO sulfur-carrier protein]-S-L-cysteine hydrolase
VTEALSLLPSVAEALLAHARAELPNEACGLVSGSLVEARARSFHPARNVHASSRRYSIHPEDLVRITYAIDGAGEDVLAVFHSHTRSPAVPSATDLRDATHPHAYYLIASLADADRSPAGAALRAWRIRDGVAAEVSLNLA